MIERKEPTKYKEFPVSLLVSNCYLKRIEYGYGESTDKYEYISLAFNKDNRWLNARLYNPIRTKYGSQKEYQSARSRLRRSLEHIASTYLDTEEMVELFHVDYTNFKDFAESFVDTLTRRNIKSISIDIKTSKYQGRVCLPTSPFFMKLSNSDEIEFRYSEYELKNIADDFL